METLKNSILALKDPSIVANFQKLCFVEIFPETEQEDVDCSSTDAISSSDEIHKTVSNKSGFIQKRNGYILNEDLCKNGSVSNGVQHLSNSKEEVVQSPDASGKAKYNVRNKLLFWIFRCSAELGNEFFYLTFFTFCFWNLNSFVTRQMVIIWHAGMYLGQAAKDYIQWPRPASPPCARLELRYEEEYGMPSTHATVGIIIPFGLVLIAHRHYEFDLMLPFLIATVWSLACGLSRMYLGMHSLLDVIVGAAIGIVLLPTMLPYVETLDKFQTTSIYGLFAVMGGSLFLLYIYPSPPVWNTAKGDTATVLAVGAGISVGTWLNCQLGYGIVSDVSPPYQIPSIDIYSVLLALLRSCIGVFVLVIIRAIAKPVSIKVLCRYFNVDPNDIETQRKIGMEKGQKFIAYFSVAVGGLYIVPTLLRYMGLMRMSFYTEF